MSLLSLKRNYGQIPGPELAAGFERYLLAIRRAAGTRRLYLAVLRRFSQYAQNPAAPTRDELHAWLRARRHAVSLPTINSELAALRAFFAWALDMGIATTDARIWLPSSRRAPRRLVRYLDVDQIDALLEAPDRTTWVGFRDHVLLRLAYETGLRASELVNLRLADVADDGLLWVHRGKGGRDRVVPFSAEMAELLRQWEIRRQEVRPGRCRRLFLTRHAKPFSSGRSIWVITQRYSAAALGMRRGYELLTKARTGIPWGGHYPHLLRASCATHLLHNGCDLRAVQEILGHENLNTTAFYLGVDLAQLKREHAKAFGGRNGSVRTSTPYEKGDDDAHRTRKSPGRTPQDPSAGGLDGDRKPNRNFG